MATTEVTITDQDLAEVLKSKVNEVTNLQVQVAALTRTLNELYADKEALDANGTGDIRKEEG
jgi:cell division protein FtsB